MASKFSQLSKAGLTKEPKWLVPNLMYEVITGSTSYGVSDGKSDMDIVAYAMPPKADLFPHMIGHIEGFSTPHNKFNVFQAHHLQWNKREYDFTVYSIAKFFKLCMDNNPNMLDALFAPQRCVLFSSRSAQHVRDNRKLFLHKGAYHKMRGYAYAQLHKIRTKSNASNPKRKESIEKFGYDVKFGYHVVRLVLQCEQILIEHDLNIEKNSEVLKSIRRGEWSKEKLFDWFDQKESALETLYNESTLRYEPDEAAIRNLLMESIEDHYGVVSEKVMAPQNNNLLADIETVLEKYK